MDRLSEILQSILSTHDIFAAVASKMTTIQRFAFYLRCENEYSLRYQNTRSPEGVQYINWYETLKPDTLMVSSRGERMYFPGIPSNRDELIAYYHMVFIYMCRNRLSMIIRRIESDKVISAEDLVLIKRAYVEGRISDISLLTKTVIYNYIKWEIECGSRYTVNNSTNDKAYDILYLARYWFNAHLKYNSTKYPLYHSTDSIIHCYRAIVRAAIVHKLHFYMYEDLLDYICYFIRNNNLCKQSVFEALSELCQNIEIDDEGYTDYSFEYDIATTLRILMKLYSNICYEYKEYKHILKYIVQLPNPIKFAFYEMLGKEEFNKYFRHIESNIGELNWQSPHHSITDIRQLTPDQLQQKNRVLQRNMRYSSVTLL